MMGAWPKWLHGLGRAQLGARTGCADCPRPTTLYYGAIALCRACAQMRALSLLTYGGVTTTMSTHRDEFGEFHIHDSGTIDIDGLTPVDDAGDAIAAYAKQLLRSGQAETLSEATHMALAVPPEQAPNWATVECWPPESARWHAECWSHRCSEAVRSV